jgi:hypothetical protein
VNFGVFIVPRTFARTVDEAEILQVPGAEKLARKWLLRLLTRSLSDPDDGLLRPEKPCGRAKFAP